MTRLLALVALWLLTTASSCATTEGPPPTTVQRETAEVSVSCVPPDMTPTPSTPPPTAAQLLALKDQAERYQALAVFWSGWTPWIGAAVPVLANCKAAAQPPASSPGAAK